ncbi:MAG: helix-turn-helix domain-containing protein [Staphylococcus sp.]|nr:helix-turn-helix domain-containing protein [Staphylococcus sp.]
MKIIRVLFILILIAASVPCATAMQNTRLFNDRSLVSSNYSSFCLDSDGSLWIGTQSGLLRFDGVSFDKYQHDENSEVSLSDNRVLKIMRDSADRIWVATCEGLNLYDKDSDSFRRIKLPNVDFYGYIADIFQQANGDIYFMASGIGLHVIDFSSGEPVAVRFMPLDQNLVNINTLNETPSGDLVVGTHGGEVIKLSPNGQSRVYKLTDSYMRIIIRDASDNLFIATTEKAWRWDPHSDVFEEIKIEGNTPVLHCAVLTRNGDILVGTIGGGLYKLDKDGDTLYRFGEYRNSDVDLDWARISTIYEDPLHNLWMGCSHQGIVMAPTEKIPFNYIKLDNILPKYSGGATAICAVPGDRSIWVGVNDGRLLNLDRYGHALSMIRFPADVTSVHASGSGKIYAGIDNNGLYEVDPVRKTSRQLFHYPGRYLASAVSEDNDGNVYIGIHGEGVVKLNPTTLEQKWITDKSGKRLGKWISTLFCDSHDRMWIGIFGSLGFYDTKTDEFHPLSENYSFMQKGVHNSFGEDKKGRIWDASSNGIIMIDPDDFSYERLTTKDGLSETFCSSIIFDNDGNAWVGTNEGINRIDPKGEVTVFRAGSYMSDIGYSSACAGGDGQDLFFSGNNGVTFFNPATLSSHRSDLDISISGFYLNDRRVTPLTKTESGSENVIADDGHINLSYRNNPLTLHMSTRDFRSVDNLFYQWRIPGLVNEWVSSAPGSNVITLPHIQSGTHELQIRGCENGEYSKIKTVMIDVSPPWYLTMPVKLVFFALICILIALAVMVLRKKNSERINEEKIKFFINVSHEIRSPLTLILGPLERIMKKEHDAETAKNLNAIHRNANRILALINQLLDIRKIDKGKMVLSCSDTEFISFTRDLVEIFQPQALEKNITLGFKTATPGLDRLNVWIDRNNFDKVLVNLITNAIKYTPEGGDISVEINHGYDPDMGDYAEISVTDTGIGLDEKNIDKLFDRFYQGKFNKGAVPLGFGIGLDLCRMLVALHNGTITAANRTDTRGSRFTVRIPVCDKSIGSGSGDAVVADSASTSQEQRKRLLVHDSAIAKEVAVRKNRNVSSVKILVVDDDAEIRNYLSDVLGNLGKVSQAVNGEEAMRKVMSLRPDLVISDVVMPEMDGLQLLKTLKSNVETNHIPVVLLSSKNDVADRMAGWDKGADGYIGKPFNINELLALIDSLLDNRLRLKGKFSGRQEQDDKIVTPELKGNDAVLIDKIVQEINDHLEDTNLNVEKLCQEVGLSRAHLNRKMKELFGLTPSEFIRNMRLRKACDLLKQGDIDISQIAYSVGFTSQPHFSTAFKRFTGFSPSEYRANVNSGQAEP